jgi:hypothetical protein
MASLGYTPTAGGWLPTAGWLQNMPGESPEMVFIHLAQKFQ